MCKYYNVNEHTYRHRLRQGWTQEQALLNLKNECITDHLGNEFKTISEMCEHYNITKSMYDTRKKQNWPLEKILTAHFDTDVQDHEGNTFKTIKDMLTYYNVPIGHYNYYKSRGYSMMEILNIIPFINTRLKNTNISLDLKIIKCASHTRVGIPYELDDLYFECEYQNHTVILNRNTILKLISEEHKQKRR